MSFPTALTIALFVAEAAAVVLAVRAAAQKRSGPDRSEPLRHFRPRWIGYPYALLRGRVLGGATRMGAALAIVKSPLVFLLVFALIDELAVLGLHAVLAGAPRPIAGLWRVPYHLENAFSLGWPALLAAVCWGRPWRRLDPLAGAWLGALAGLILVYPTDPPGSGSPRLRWTFLAWEVLMVALAWAGLYRARFRPWGPAERCLVILAACESAVVIVGPFASDPFLRWWIARAFYLGAWGLVSAVLVKRR